MAKTIIKIESSRKGDIDTFFGILSDRVGDEIKRWDHAKGHTCVFELNFKELKKCVGDKKLIVTKNVTVKQDNSKNKELAAKVKKYKDKGLSLAEIAAKLNSEGFTNSRGNEINRQQVYRLTKM